MKKQRLLMAVAATMLFSITVVMVVSCKKNSENQQTKTTANYEESEAVLAHVLDFKNRMEYHKANPGLKDGTLYTAPDATEELEALLNLTFSYIDITVNQKEFVKTEVTMPLDELGKIGESKLAQLYYEEIIDSIQAMMLRINYTNMKLILVDLKQTGTDSNGDAIVGIGVLVGNEGSIPSGTSEDGWWYGFEYGTCEHQNMGLDAAMLLQGDLQFAHIVAPPPGYKRMANLIETIGPLDPTEFRTPNDPLDNEMDYRIYYAINDGDELVIDDYVRCLSNAEEMPFYLYEYDFLIDSCKQDYNLDFVDCLVEGYEEWGEAFIRHDYTIYLGDVWLVPIYWDTEDILAY